MTDCVRSLDEEDLEGLPLFTISVDGDGAMSCTIQEQFLRGSWNKVYPFGQFVEARMKALKKLKHISSVMSHVDHDTFAITYTLVKSSLIKLLQSPYEFILFMEKLIDERTLANLKKQDEY
ncbi:MAG TPA: hypothetical protein VF622_20590 [Segetibacter sp.]|jgi:hypothetical protein